MLHFPMNQVSLYNGPHEQTIQTTTNQMNMVLSQSEVKWSTVIGVDAIPAICNYSCDSRYSLVRWSWQHVRYSWMETNIWSVVCVTQTVTK